MLKGPCSVPGRLIALAWTLACLAVLIFAYLQRDAQDVDVAFSYLMLFLTFPAGYGIGVVFGYVAQALHASFGIAVPGGAPFRVVAWALFVVVGYLQWFVLVPWLYRKAITSLRGSAESHMG